MSNSVIVPIVFFAVAAVLILVALGWVLVNKQRKQRRHVQADELRERAENEAVQVKQREALADETAAKARAAQADAEVKAAQASGLEQQAAAHRSEAETSRDRLDEQRDRADALDPPSQSPEKAESTDRK